MSLLILDISIDRAGMQLRGAPRLADLSQRAGGSHAYWTFTQIHHPHPHSGQGGLAHFTHPLVTFWLHCAGYPI